MPTMALDQARRSSPRSSGSPGRSSSSSSSSSAGGVGFLQVTDFGGPNPLTVKIRHSDTGGAGTWSDLLSFSAISGGQTAPAR